MRCETKITTYPNTSEAARGLTEKSNEGWTIAHLVPTSGCLFAVLTRPTMGHPFQEAYTAEYTRLADLLSVRDRELDFATKITQAQARSLDLEREKLEASEHACTTIQGQLTIRNQDVERLEKLNTKLAHALAEKESMAANFESTVKHRNGVISSLTAEMKDLKRQVASHKEQCRFLHEKLDATNKALTELALHLPKDGI